MNTIGIITEYNPLHMGHVYHIEQAKKLTNADSVMCVMSGNFVQRGEPAIIDKYTRTAMALNNGVDLLFELPTYYSCASAEGFAYGAVMTLEKAHAKYVCFGSECGNIKALENIAELLCNEPKELSNMIKDMLILGMTYPKARAIALSDYLNNSEYSQILSSPNNILGIEYIKVIKKYNLNIKPVTIKRKGEGYKSLNTASFMPSASAIRNSIIENYSKELYTDRNIDLNINSAVPNKVSELLKKSYGINYPMEVNDFSKLLNYKLFDIINNYPDKLTIYEDITPELANRIIKCYTGTQTFTALADTIKNKQLTYSRISRSLMHIILNITKEQNTKYYCNTFIPYIRLLGMNNIGQKMLSSIKKNCDVPIIAKPANYKEILQHDIYAANLYNLISYEKFNAISKSEFNTVPDNELKHSPIINTNDTIN